VSIVIQQRAYSDEQKNQRRSVILSAAEKLFKLKQYDDVTMVDIATLSAVSKGTLYVYFRTKDEIFLVYAKQEIDLFFGRLQGYLTAQSEPSGVKGVIKALGSAYAESQYMIRLLAVLHRVLESKLGFDNVLDFRRKLIPLLEVTGTECERHLCFLKKGEGKRLLLTIHGISLGLQQLADPTDVMQQVELQPDMAVYRFEFQSTLLSTVDLLLAGMEVRSKQSTN